MRQYRPQRLLLLFGSSVQRPLEAYDFQLPAPAGQHALLTRFAAGLQTAARGLSSVLYTA